MTDIHNLLILIVVVWVMGKIFRFISLPVIFGELLGGILVGPMLLNLVNPDNLTIKILAELGIFFLMLHSGVEADPNDLLKGTKKSFLIALLGVLVPFVLGFLILYLFNFPILTSVFISTVISATAIAISIRILKDYKLNSTRFGKTVLSAAILTDLIILILFSIIVKIAENGTVETGFIILAILKIILYFGLVFYIGIKAQKYFQRLFKNKGFTLTLIIALSLGYLAELMGLHMVIGAFMAGLFINEHSLDTHIYHKIEDRIYGLSYSFLGPLFFTSLAFNLRFEGIVSQPLLFILLFLSAYLGKLIGSGGGALLQKIPIKKALMIGLVLNSRGALDLIIISIGLEKGIITNHIFSILISLAFLTTIISILTLKPLKLKIIQN